jgi:hypothetical protein
MHSSCIHHQTPDGRGPLFVRSAGRQRLPVASAQLPAPLQDLRPLPAGADLVAVRASEGPTFYWLDKVYRSYETWLSCRASEAQLLPPGW